MPRPGVVPMTQRVGIGGRMANGPSRDMRMGPAAHPCLTTRCTVPRARVSGPPNAGWDARLLGIALRGAGSRGLPVMCPPLAGVLRG